MGNKYSNYKVGSFAGVSEATIRNMKKNNIEKYENILKKYQEHLKKEKEMSKKKIIAATNLKGGVGKSSILNILVPTVENSVIINIDFASGAENINSAKTIDYGPLSQDHSLEEVIKEALEEFDNVFIDTPGDITDELIEVIDMVDHFIIPFNAGERSRTTSIDTFRTLFSEGIIEGKHKLAVVLNNYTNDGEKEEELEIIKNAIESTSIEDDLKLSIGYTSLKSTLVMKTMEKTNETIEELNERNKLAYRVAHKRFSSLSSDLRNILKLPEKQ